MKILHRLKSTLSTAAGAMVLGVGLLAVETASANPYASSITYNPTNGNVQFYLNESNATVTVTYEDGSTNTIYNGLGAATNVAAGPQTFNITNNSIAHTGYAIACYKLGKGTPYQYTSDFGPMAYWSSPRGVDVNKNAKNGANFGRMYVGNSSTLSTNSTLEPMKQAIYALTPDFKSSAIGTTNYTPLANGVCTFGAASANSPLRFCVGPDDTVYMVSYAGGNATVYSFDANFSVFTNVVLRGQGETAGLGYGVHSDPTGVFVTGSVGTSNLVVYTFDPGLALTYSNALFTVDPFGNPTYHLGSDGQSIPGSYNNIFKYVIGADTNATTAGVPQPYGGPGPAPWTNSPDMGVNVGLPNFDDVGFGDVTVEPNGYTVAMFERANFSDGNIQVYDTNFNLIYTSLQPNGTDPFNTSVGAYVYGGVRVSPDGQYLATITIDDVIELCNLTNGVPDVSSMQYVTALGTGNARGLAFDAADNLIYDSSGQTVLRGYSLGYTSTCVTSNDISGTNGTFSLVFPSARAGLAITQATASQNYTNIVVGNAPIPASFTITLNTSTLPAPVTVNIGLTGTATNGVNYILNHGFDANGVYITNTTVTFPAGTFGGSGNWTTTVYVTPTASPVSGPTLTVNVAVAGGATYIPTEPVTGSLVIMNTGPQKLLLSAAAYGTTMSRAVPNDYAEFILTRYGDVSVGSYTVTNFTFSGTGAYPVDYTAGAQNFNPPPVDGVASIVVSSGATSFTNIIGNPVARANLYQPPTNVTITISLTNAVTGTNNTSQEGVAYTVGTGTVTLTEEDNAIGGEVVLWSDSLTSALESTNWTVTYATSSLGTNTVLPVVVPNYTNNESTVYASGGTNDFVVLFGNPVSNDGINPSPTMTANGWTTALKASIENSFAAVSGLNIYPQNMRFQGNYALRFDMYLRLYDRALNNRFYSGVNDRQFAIFGIDTSGTNCDWRPTAAVLPGFASGQGSGVTNWDGIWFAIDAGINSLTPADYDAFASPVKPNNSGADTDLVSNRGETENGVFKDPPFSAVKSLLGTYGGEPVDQWVDVSVETTMQTNISLYMNHSQVLSSFANTNAGAIVIGGVPVCSYTNGTIMLGYEDPLPDVSDGSAYVYYSNVRVVELSPYLTANPANVIAISGSTVSFTQTVNFASAPLTNTWYLASTSPIGSVVTNVVNATNMTGILTLPNVQVGTNYEAVFSDAAGSVTGAVANVEVIESPANVSTYSGDTVTFSVSASGSSAPTSYQWKFNGTNLVSNTHFAGATGATLTITNAQISDAGTYSVAVVNAAGTVTPAAVLSVTLPSTPAFSSITRSGANVLMSFTTLDTSVTTKSFVLLSSPTVNGPYTTNTSAVITGSNGSFQISVPSTTNSTMFYQIYDY